MKRFITEQNSRRLAIIFDFVWFVGAAIAGVMAARNVLDRLTVGRLVVVAMLGLTVFAIGHDLYKRVYGEGGGSRG